ncbi:MAG: chromosome segregation protein SMC [Clostridia bacterium]|nr:chromosome segregation protein SMC [Clostridia bacterium]
MQLKKLEIQGFKSFADKTEIVFLDGITTIVGPNGSGKSNISDAVRWVLGEQSVKNLRGSKMEDVIFAGTEARKKVGFAEVSMYLDNSDGELPVEFREVVVTRRVYRTGESNYLINGTECRLKDIQELFMDTGLGKDGYSIISQGKVDEILSSKSEERRHIFEEASGIVKYRTRKEEATRKLENTEATLIRLSDIIAEIENTIGPLEKKAEVAKEYLRLRDELKNLDVKLFIQSVDKNSDGLKKLDDMIDALKNDILLQENDSKEIEDAKLKLKEQVREITEKIEQAKEKYYTAETETEKLNSRIGILNASIDTSNQNVDRLKGELSEDAEKIELLKEEIEKRIKKRNSMSENKMKFENELQEKQKELEKMIATLDGRGLEIEELKKQIDLQMEEKYNLKADVSSMNATIEANEKQLEEKKKLEEKSTTQKDSLNALKNDVYLELSHRSNELKNIISTYEETINKLNNIESNMQIVSNDSSKLNQDIMTLKAKYNYMMNLEAENEGYNKSVKSVLDFAKESHDDKVYGTVASLISTDEKYEYAIEIALGGFLQNVVVENDSKAKEMISYLNQNSLGRVTFLPLDSVVSVDFAMKNKIAKFDGVIGIAPDLVRFDGKYKKVVELALNNTVIVDNIDTAIVISKKLKNVLRFVTLDGELINTTGSITGGKTKNKSAGLIGRQEKIANLKVVISEKEEKYLEYKNQIDRLQKEKSDIEVSLEEISNKKDSLNIEVATFTEKFENVKRELQKIETQKESSVKLLENLNAQNDKMKSEIKDKENRIVTIDEDNTAKQSIIDEYARFNKEKQKEIDFLNEDIVNLKISLSSFDESVASIDEMKEKIEQDILNFENGIEKKEEQIEKFSKSVVDYLKEIEEIKEQVKEKSKFKIEFLEYTDTLKTKKEEIEQEQEKLNQSTIECVKKQEKLKQEIEKVESKKIKFNMELENLKNRMWEEYEITISNARSLAENIQIEEKDISKKAEKIRKNIKDLGEVNISAIEEYKSTKERYDFITKQKLDLEETKTKLNSLINNMTSIMKGQFSKQFKVITENFNETFKELFGGGKADLKLSDENDVLNSGIEIEVQPPGKKLQNMMLLSGGERALTATALLFAILKIKSPPFCILDEIEAALDDVNVHRFAEYIKKYSKKNQFIVITHRKGTMEVASSVYGVTMQEYGISKVVSMKLS